MAVVTTNLGVITAYGDAVAAGYTGTKAEWQALMASYATVAKEAQDYANAAAKSATDADSAKDDAITAKNNAETAKSDAITAKNDAVTAKNDAQTAKTDAEKAKDDAQDIVDGINAKSEKIDQNATAIEDLKSDLDERVNKVVSSNLFDKSNTVVGRLTTVKGEYNTSFASYNASAVIELDEEIISPVFYTTDKPAELFTWNSNGESNGTLSYSNFSVADNGHGYKSVVLTGARVKFLAISWRVSDTYTGSGYINTDNFVLSTSPLSGEYVPFSNYPTLYGDRAALFAELPTVPTVIPQFEQITSSFVGTDAGKYNTESSSGDEGKYNTGVGTKALNANTSGNHNTALGFQTMNKNTTGSSNTGLGEDSLYECTTGSQNTGTGIRTLQNLTTGERNTAIGAIAGYGITTGNQNTFVGQNAGNNTTTESNNTCVGYWSNVSAGVENSTAIGRGASATKSNQVVLGNANVTENVLHGDVIVISNNIYHKLVFNNDGSISWVDVTP